MENLYLRIAEFGYKNPQWFTIQQLREGISSNENEDIITDKHFRDAYDLWISSNTATRETPFFLFENFHWGYSNCTYWIKTDILFSYIDYLEFQEAIKSSKHAMWTAIAAIFISIVAIGVQIYTSISTQIDEKQFIEIKNIISSEIKK